jgi:hypothetical protein
MSISTGSKSSVGLVGSQHAAFIRKSYPDDGELFAQHVGDLAVGAEGFHTRTDDIAKSKFYTPAGLPGVIEPEARAWRAAQVQFRKNFIDPLAAEERRLLAEASKPAPAKAEELVIRALRHREIRDRFAAVADPLDRVLAVDRLAAAGDVDALNAISEAPFEKLVDPAVMAKARQRMAVAASPDLTRVQTLKGAYEQVAAVAGAELRSVLERFGIQLDAPIK